MNNRALVTGSSSGIGIEIADLLALKGYDLLLVSNDEKGLEAAKNRLQSHPVEIDLFCLDLAREAAGQELVGYTHEQGMEIEVLVNNAGMFFFSEVAETSPEKAQKLVNLHMMTVSQLCILFGKQMKERKRGFILNTSSISAYKDFPGIAFYGASKAFIKSFTRSLRTEMRMYNVHVTCLSPGATATNLYDDKGINVELGKKVRVMMSARRVAAAGVRGLFRNRANVIPGVMTNVMLFFAYLTPHWIIYLIRKKGPWLK